MINIFKNTLFFTKNPPLRKILQKKILLSKHSILFYQKNCFASQNVLSKGEKVQDAETIVKLKRDPANKKSKQDSFKAQGFFNVNAYTTAEEYDLENLLLGIEEQELYTPKKFFSTDYLGAQQDVLYVRAKYEVDKEPRDIFFFREGVIVLWNCDSLENNNVLNFIKNYEKDRYLKPLIQGESEVMPYAYVSENEKAKFKDSTFYLSQQEDNFLEKYTFSNALSTTIKLGIWEAILDRYINSLHFITEDLKKGRKIKITRAELLRKTGELFALRHSINLSSDLLDTPDFYWDREELENLYNQVCNYFSISRRTRVMNEKLNHCIELADLVSSNLNDAHHVRLEWMIIILIMVEVAFEIVHYADRYYESKMEEDRLQTNLISQ
ncbi:required for meiotic nuclear division protein 1 homolog [Condylostylus longicornis]|uniref:required for meiotic nuclear division protein 1 homolog n=1 Tax=Condylostylus longicornis TaxID=2530218 RepID=UPI00244E1CE0|nr:required for meiotic nuclear division protein 1 homolog [Condylostylus longicornis]